MQRRRHREMQSTPQRVYAANLRQNLGYPLRNPRPNIELGRPYSDEGFQIGDVGHVDRYGEFRWLFNVKFPSEVFGLDPPDEIDPDFDRTVPRQGCDREAVFVSGAKQSVEGARTNGHYKFLATSKAGAILILPEGATLFELEDKYSDKIREIATNHAVHWCKKTGQESLYLLTAAYKTKAWTLGAFDDGSPDGEIYVDQQSDGTYNWKYSFTTDHQQAPASNSNLNQTVFIKGFKMTVRRDLLHALARVESANPEQWFPLLLAKLRVKTQKWLSGRKIEYFPALNFSQPSHPLDIINHFLLDKNPAAQTAVTHDNDWIEMLNEGLSPADLMEDGPLRNFLQKRYAYDLGPEKSTVYLRRNLSRSSTACEHEPTLDHVEETNDECKPDDEQTVPSDNSRLVITNMRLESFNVDHIDAGVCVLVHFGTMTRRTVNKSCANIIEWDDSITLPPNLPVYVTVCGVFQLGSTLGTREISAKQTINPNDLSGSTYTKRFHFGDSDSRSSLLITLERHFSYCDTYYNYDGNSVFIDKTLLGFEAFYSHQMNHLGESLETALDHFRVALDQCVSEGVVHRATASFNLATAELVRCHTNGTYSQLAASIDLYQEALTSRGDGHQDRPATLLLLAQALLSHHGREHDESVTEKIEQLLAEFLHDDSRDRRTADAVIATCRFHRAVNSQDSAEVDGLLKDLERGVYEPAYGYFDRPRLVHKLGVAFWRRFQSSADLDDLDKSIELNAEAVRVPEGHEDRNSIVACLGNSFLCALEARGELTDLDTSVSLTELGKQVVTKLSDGTFSVDAGRYSETLQEQMERMAATEDLRERMELMSAVEITRERMELVSAPEKLREQIELMSAADGALQAIIEQDPSPRNPEVQRPIDEWNEEEGSPVMCKKQLGVLLSFLGGEGEVKMREVLEELDFEWPYKNHKIAGTTRTLQGYMPYFYSVLSSRLRCLMEGWA